ncbi:MAG: 2Fe-2S iron-sulfur cluster-binding protein [Mariprofundaceae bacterium]|nr:2Fe-2S iron-sulfur cluster-binding protein [Mariprofundaceae bacterium]
MAAIHTIHLTTQDGGALAFECAEDEHLIEAGARAGVYLPSRCRAGNCGTCHARCATGEYELQLCNSVTLPEEAVAEGDILMCRTFPRSAMTVEVAKNLADITSGPVRRD